MKNIVILVLFLGFIGSLQAQSKRVNKLEKITFKKYALGLSPSAFLNYYPGVQLSHDIGVHDYVNIAVETAYIFGGQYSENFFSTRGYRLKSGLQLMAASNKYIAVNLGVFYVLRQTNAPRQFTVNFWEEEYFELVKYDRKKVVSSSEFNISIYAAITNRLRFEAGAGIGVGFIDVSDSNSTQTRDQQSFEFREWTFNAYDSPGNQAFFLGAVNFNLSYILVR